MLITTSSKDMANASSTPDRIAGRICGSITSRNTCHFDAPRSKAASSREWSIPTSLALTIVKIYGTQNVVWAITNVTIPNGRPIRENTDKNTIPRMISGIMIGRVDT